MKARVCLLYIGKSDGTAVLYDVSNRESLRVPADDVVIVLSYGFRVSKPCREAEQKLTAEGR